MTATAATNPRSTPNLSIPHTQNTAPVLEFNCLYTHDLRRKQKRWQDGFLRYHTFNKRIMVYDVPRNFLGDLHWTESADLQEGDEVMLEKGGVLVQVAEQVGRTETDLSELLHRKDKSPPPKNAYSPSPSRFQGVVPRSQASLTPRPQPNTGSVQTKHKSLNSLLGPSRGVIGKAALPAKSPFEQRNNTPQALVCESGREAKRQKTETWNLTRTTKLPKPKATAATPSSRPKAGNATTSSRARAVGEQRKLNVTEVVDLSSDAEETPARGKDGYLTDIDLLTSSPANLAAMTTTASNGMPENPSALGRGPGTCDRPLPVDPEVVASPSVRQLQRKEALAIVENPMGSLVEEHQALREPTTRDQQIDAEQRKSPPVRSANTTSVNPPGALKMATVSMGANSQKHGTALKLGGSAPRRMLVFQGQKTSRASDSETRNPVDSHLPQKGHKEVGGIQQPLAVPDIGPEGEPQSIHKQRVKERLDRIGKKQRRESDTQEAQRSPTETTAASAINTCAAIPSIRHPVATEESSHHAVQDSRPGAAPIRSRPHDSISAPSAAPKSHASKDMPPPPLPPPPPPPSPPPQQVESRKTKAKESRQTRNVRSEGTESTALGRTAQMPAARPVTSAVANKEPLPKQKDLDLGPWSKEAFDLMDWRPPDRRTDGGSTVAEGGKATT